MRLPATEGSPASVTAGRIPETARARSSSAVSLRATAVTGAPASASPVAIPRPRPRLAPTTIVVLSDRLVVDAMTGSPLAYWSTGGGEGGLPLADRVLRNGVGEPVSPDES